MQSSFLIIGVKSSKSLHGILPACVGEPTDECQPLNLSSGGEYTLLTYLEVDPSEAESSDSASTAAGASKWFDLLDTRASESPL